VSIQEGWDAMPRSPARRSRDTASNSILRAAAALLVLALAAGTADARAIRWARSGDALTLDPHAQNEGPTHTLLQQIYEPLILRHLDGKLLPTLALSWKVTSDPTVWEFKLRPNVKFHNGNAFDADDVIFSIARALQAASAMKGLLTSIDKVTKIDPLTIHITTKGPNPLLPAYLTTIYIMDKEWSEANSSTTVQDFKEKKDNFAVRNANGTGAYALVSREQDVKTVLQLYDDYWGKGQFPLGITEITYLTIKSDATRVAALLSGEVDFVQDVPVQDIERLEKTPGIKVNFGPENRTIFFGLDVGSPELKSSDIKGRNPFADRRVRQAMNMAIDRDAIRKVVMRGQSVPAGIVAPPFVNGYTKELDSIPKVDAAVSKKLLADAGYANGFSVTLHCPNDRYVSDESVCQATASMMARIGIKVNLASQSKSLHFPLIEKDPPETEFYMLGWGVPTYDSHYVFGALYHSRTNKEGGFNGTRYANAQIDQAIDGLTQETDEEKRNIMIAEIWKTLQEETIYLPLHHQTLAFAMKDAWDFPTSPQNAVHMKNYAPRP
jgi:peptide/nickel transport system substrate-binding protein